MLSSSEKYRYALLDTFSGLDILNYYRHFRDSFSWSADRIAEHRDSKLRNLIRSSCEKVPYYRDLFRKAGITPDDIKTVNDLNILPVLTRDHLRDNFERLKNEDIKQKNLFISSSSGTTGTPVKYIHDYRAESAGIAAGYALYSLSGWKLGERKLHIWGNPSSIKKWNRNLSKIKQAVIGQKNYPAFLLNDQHNYKHLLSLINSYKPLYIDGYASTIGSFACWLREERVKLNGIKAVFTTAENLTASHRQVISETIGPVSDLFGCGEINGIAIQPVDDDKYFILETHVIVEYEEFNGSCEILVTDLDNNYMPLIRYKTGDTVDSINKADDLNNLPFGYFRHLDGRVSDFIKLNNGKILHPVNILGGTFLRKFPGIRRHKVIWDGTVLDFVIETSDKIDPGSLEETIRENLDDKDIRFTISFRSRILPDANGKYRYIEIKNPELE